MFWGRGLRGWRVKRQVHHVFFQQGELGYHGQGYFTGRQIPRRGFCAFGYEMLTKNSKIYSLRLYV